MTDYSTLKCRASELRKNQTAAECALWRRLRLRRLDGVRFLRQRPLGPYIVDFYAPSIRLVVELDGGQHYEPDARAYDTARTRWLASKGVVVLRYTNLDVSRRLDDVLEDVHRVAMQLRRGRRNSAGR